MGDLSRYFSKAEAVTSQTAFRQGIDNTPPLDIWANIEQTAKAADQVRDLLNRPMHISSWFRCLKLNRAIGSADTSDHPNGWCIDFICPEVGSPYQVAAKILASGIPFDQLIMEGTWVHWSASPKMRRQALTLIAGGHYKPGISEH